MAKLVVEHTAAEELVDISAYDKNKWSSGGLIKKRSDIGTNPFIGPIVTSVARPFEMSAFPGIYPHVIRWSNDIDWIFLADNSTAAATRRILLYTYNRSNGAWSYIGSIILTYPAAGTYIIRSLRMLYEKYTTGTVSVSSTTVTGNGSSWTTDRLAAGSRIGFGSNDPTQISSWYYISSVDTNTSLTLTADAGTIAAGTAYVIEDLRCVTVTTNSTTVTNGGVFVAKGLNKDIFTAMGTTIPGATTVDNIRAVYWLADAATLTNTVAAGSGMIAKTSWQSQDFYVLNTALAGNYNVYKYNLRKDLVLSAGKDTSSFILKTNNQAVSGTVSQTNNCRFGTLTHGPAANTAALYFVTSTKIYCAKLTSITSGSSNWIDYTMSEVPPGGTSTFPVTNALVCVEIIDTIDRLIVVSSGTAGARSYITKYNNSNDPMDHIFLVDDKQIDQSNVDSGAVVHPSIMAVQQSPWAEGGLLYLASVGTTALNNILHVMPIGADWQYAATTGQRLISPVFSCPNNNQFSRVYTIRDSFQGSVNLGKPCDPFRTYYRTSGIDDNTGTWLLVADGNDISGAGNSNFIQFMFEFKCISDICVAGRIFSVGVTYEDLSTDSHFQPSVANSDKTNKRFAWRFSSAFGGTVPKLRIRLYDAVTGNGPLVDDDSVTKQNGTWEMSTDGGSSWVAYDLADKTNDLTYIRFTPTSLADNIRVRALLTLY